MAALLASARAGAGVSPAAELVREARAHEQAHEEDLALRRYAEALAVDPTLEDAYLGLGALRLRMGDAREAERVYETALSHLPGFAPALLGRGRARRALGALTAADADLEAYVDSTADATAMRQLAAWYAEEGRPLAELAAWRRLLGAAEREVDGAARKEARLTVHALELLVGTVDPVRAPPADASAVRRGLARMERRR
jgi:tetratricopeptide (TPR) repeat protein